MRTSTTLTQRTLPLVRPVVDVSAWPVVGIEQMGSKPKRWLEAPDGSRWLFKELTRNSTRGGQRFLRGDDWSEAISTDLARTLGLPTATVELAVGNESPGVVSRSIADRSALVHGNEILSRSVPGYGNTARYNPLYSVGAVMDVASRVAAPPDFHLPATVAFGGYLVLDALVGNTDRHHENWALLVRRHHATQLAPSFDHASSLGFLLSDGERAERLTTRDSNRTVEAFVARTKTPFASAASPLEAALQAVSRLSRLDRRLWVDTVASVSVVLDDLVRTIPEARMSDLARTFALRMLELNQRATLRRLREVA